ncbi:MAG: L,D-transpeptidase, partial [Chlamydiia bacterium]|nr:L,D-transpeptidase [Chlamydiia bacterium]
ISADKDVRFHLLVDVSRSRAWFYALDMGDQKRYLLKTYNVGLGRPNPSNPSGCLTPLGTYELGDRIAIYKPKATGWFNGEKVEMIKVFGSRWIPFEKEIANCSAPAKGFGIHGAPWEEDSATGELREERACIGKFESDGCIRFVTEDIEEIFAIVITRPTTIDIVKRFEDAVLPGEEVAL